MTAFAINTGGVVNWDTRTGGSTNATLDSYDISAGSTLLIDTDSYQCANHSAAFGSLDTVTFSGIGGKLKIDGTAVRVIPFNTGTGNVPAIGTTITQGGVSATLLGVWASWLVEPTASGSAMPTSGFIKVKGKTGGDFAAGALTGIGASATGADVVGWIEVRGADTATITVPRIGAFEVVGDWFELGTTNGTRGQVIPCPTTATVAGVFPGVWIETGNGTGVFERFAGAGSIVALASIPTDERGKIVWQTTGGIRIGSDGTNNVGFLPPTGCRVRIPNVILTCCTRTAGSGSGPRVLPNATLATRQEFVTTASGDITISKCVFQWYGNFLQAFRADVVDSAISDTLILQEIASPINVSNAIVAPTQAQLNNPLNMLSCFAGGTIANSLFVRFSLAASGAYCNVSNFNKGVVYSNVKTQTLLNRANATTGTWTITQNVDCEWNSCVNIGGRMLLTTAQRPKITNLRYANQFSGTTGSGNPHSAIDLVSGCADTMVDGMDFLGIADQHPYTGLVSATSCYNTTFRNVGSTSAALSLGSANQSGVIFTGAGNNDGIRLQRLYCSNTRTAPWSFVNSDNGVTIETVAGDYADSVNLLALNCAAKGVRCAFGVGSQTAVYGTHWRDSFASATTGIIEVACHEPTALTAAQAVITGGSPKFNSNGQIALTVVGDEITWEMPYFAKGHTALANALPVRTGTTPGNLTIEFQYDIGSGYNGSWLTATAANLGAVSTIDPAIGIRLKLRARCATASSGNLLTFLGITTVTTATAQNQQYPLDTFVLELTGLKNPSEVRVFNAGTTTQIAGQENVTTGTFSTAIDSGTYPSVDIAILALGYQNTRLLAIDMSGGDVSIPVQQILDRQYLNP